MKRLSLQLYLRSWLPLLWASSCQTSLFCLFRKRLFYHLIPFSEWGKFSLWAPVSSGLVSKRGMCQHVCSDSLKLRPGPCWRQSSPGKKGYLVLSLFSCATGRCWAVVTQGAGLEGLLVSSSMAIPMSLYRHIRRVLRNVEKRDFSSLKLFSLTSSTSRSSRCFIIPFHVPVSATCNVQM